MNEIVYYYYYRKSKPSSDTRFRFPIEQWIELDKEEDGERLEIRKIHKYADGQFDYVDARNYDSRYFADDPRINVKGNIDIWADQPYTEMERDPSFVKISKEDFERLWNKIVPSS